ncbi:MAG TPA: sigma-70 family RNA polymerase sigma factor [Actinoplanes sp.]|nr:sigma-70 family RNA polymerase sigma factor [Actinoplanes sp.]
MSVTHLVVRARAGDRAALDDLVRFALPLVYTVVRRALGTDPAVDDVVQEVMLRMLRTLPDLQAAERFRPWLMAITLRRIGTHLERAGAAARRRVPLDDAAALPDPAGLEEATLLRVELSRQRRQVMRAGQWLDTDHRALLPLWGLLIAGELTRAEMAEALGLSAGHAGVRLQRMRAQLELCRSIVVALDATPGCAGLAIVVADWDGVPGALWRKRIGRHIDSCEVCRAARSGLIAPERLLAGLALLPVPAALAASIVDTKLPAAVPVMMAQSTGELTRVGVLGRLADAAGSHPVAAAVSTGVLAAVVAVTLTGSAQPADRVAGPATPAPRTGPPVTASTAALPLGRVSLEPVDAAGRFLTVAGDRGVLAPGRPGSTFEVVPGLADAGCYSFRTGDGRLLRHASWRLRADREEGTALFQRDATFCVRPGASAGSVALESANYPRFFVRHLGDEFWVDESDGSPAFAATSSFLIRPPRT